MLATTHRIPFNRPSLLGRELEYIQQAVLSGGIAGDATFTLKCHRLLEEILGVPKVLLTTSCTHALEMCALLLDIREGDEVILPSFTFVSTVNAFVLRGAKPIFCDIRPDTLNIDESLIQSLITEKTKAIVLVHYGGVGCEMESMNFGLPIIEDNAHGLFGAYRGKKLGTFGALATQSFHETKNVTCGEGGALVINDPLLIERAEIIREKGTNRSNFFRGMVDKYTWVDVGSSYLPSDVLAAFLLAQLEEREGIQQRRAAIWHRYDENLSHWAKANSVRTPMVPQECEQAYHMFYLLMPDLVTRTRFISHMRERGILCAFHYLPLHISKMGREYGGQVGQCPVTERVSDQLVRLPFYNDLDEDSQAEVIDAIVEFQVSL